MLRVEVKVDLSQVEHLANDFRRAEESFIEKLTERGAEILREEEPVRSGALRRGTKAEVDPKRLTGEIVIDFTPQGQEEDGDWFFYPAGLLSGTGLYGPRGKVVSALSGRVLSFAVGGRRVLVKSVKGMHPNSFDERTERRLDAEVEKIFDEAMDAVAAAATR